EDVERLLDQALLRGGERAHANTAGRPARSRDRRPGPERGPHPDRLDEASGDAVAPDARRGPGVAIERGDDRQHRGGPRVRAAGARQRLATIRIASGLISIGPTSKGTGARAAITGDGS